MSEDNDALPSPNDCVNRPGTASSSAEPWADNTCNGPRPEKLRNNPAHEVRNSMICGASAMTRITIAPVILRAAGSDAARFGIWPVVSAICISSTTGLRRPVLKSSAGMPPARPIAYRLSSDNTSETQAPAYEQEPERIEPRRGGDDGGSDGRKHSHPAVIGSLRHNQGARRHQPDRERHQ